MAAQFGEYTKSFKLYTLGEWTIYIVSEFYLNKSVFKNAINTKYWDTIQFKVHKKKLRKEDKIVESVKKSEIFQWKETLWFVKFMRYSFLFP